MRGGEGGSLHPVMPTPDRTPPSPVPDAYWDPEHPTVRTDTIFEEEIIPDDSTNESRGELEQATVAQEILQELYSPEFRVSADDRKLLVLGNLLTRARDNQLPGEYSQHINGLIGAIEKNLSADEQRFATQTTEVVEGETVRTIGNEVTNQIGADGGFGSLDIEDKQRIPSLQLEPTPAEFTVATVANDNREITEPTVLEPTDFINATPETDPLNDDLDLGSELEEVDIRREEEINSWLEQQLGVNPLEPGFNIDLVSRRAVKAAFPTERAQLEAMGTSSSEALKMRIDAIKQLEEDLPYMSMHAIARGKWERYLNGMVEYYRSFMRENFPEEASTERAA